MSLSAQSSTTQFIPWLFTAWSWSPGTAVAVLLVAFLYGRGWLRLRRFAPDLATHYRLSAFCSALLLIIIATMSPIFVLSDYFLAARALQKVLLCMIVPPLFWLSCPFQCMARGMPWRWRTAITRQVLRNGMTKRLAIRLLQPGIIWILFVATFLLWHEPQIMNWSMNSLWAHRLSMGVLLAVSLLYWWRIVDTGPRIYAPLSAWAGFLYLVGVELPNMFAGISIAFSRTPLYPYYETMRATTTQVYEHLPRFGLIEDQMLSGGLIWITGSIVYIFTIVLMLNQMFKRESGMPPLLQFTDDADERTIAPGLEYRVQRRRWRQAGYGQEEGSR